MFEWFWTIFSLGAVVNIKGENEFGYHPKNPSLQIRDQKFSFTTHI